MFSLSPVLNRLTIKNIVREDHSHLFCSLSSVKLAALLNSSRVALTGWSLVQIVSALTYPNGVEK